MKRFIYPILLVALTLSACGSPGPMAESTRSRERSPKADSASMQTLVDGNNAFALDVYQTLRSESGNLILSPFSMSLALAMTYAGARGDTAAQMAAALHYDLPAEKLHPAFNALDLALEETPLNLDKDQEPLQLNIANGIWAEQTQPFEQEFLDTIALNYGAGIHLADFKTKYEPARKEINTWVEDQTEDRIKDLIPQDAVNPDTRMVLVNAIYFKADWLLQFDANSTYAAPFNLLDGSTVDADRMHERVYSPYMQGDGFQAIELDYAGQTASMVLLVPDESRFAEFESVLDGAKFNSILSSMQQTPVILGLPKFEFTKDFSLSDALKSLGMTDAFDGAIADFSGMTGKKDLFISDVIHKAFVKVDEEGTEAAAATAVIMETGAAAPSDDVSLIIDRPFIFIIRDKVNGQILFIGRVLNPK